MRNLAFALFALGCSQPATGAGPSYAQPEERRDIDRSAGHVSVGLRVDLDETDRSRAHIVAVVESMDGAVETTDLGEYAVEAVSEIEAGNGEVGHVRYEDHGEMHDLVLMRTDDPAVLELRLDGERVRELRLPAGQGVQPHQPFLLSPPTL
ncbi:MAG: hypothetical protein AAF645_04130 [Myxococcota bacterium]